MTKSTPLKTFYQDVDKRSKKAMVDFLSGHYRYNTMNSWNNSTSYANKVKIWDVIPSSLQDKVFEMMAVDDFYTDINDTLRDWGEENKWEYQAGFNGRSGGYIVMYQGYRKLSEHKSFCTCCGQRNFKLVPDFDTTTEEGKFKLYLIKHPMWTDEVYLRRDSETKQINISDDELLSILKSFKRKANEYTASNKCGKCGELARVNKEFNDVGCWPGKSIDQGEDFEDWSMDSLKNRVELVQSFDKMCDDVVSQVIYMAENNEVVEETIMVPKTIKYIQ